MSLYDPNWSPSELGLSLLNQYCNLVVPLVQTGTHLANPYHNQTHILQVVYWAAACYFNESSGRDSLLPECELREAEEARQFDIETLLIAAAFHDHNHSGGKLTDDLNIKRALKFVETNLLYHGKTDAIFSLISCTEFVNGKFTREPYDLLSRCLRDADLMAIYSHEGRELLLGLHSEMNLQDLNRHMFAKRNYEFLSKAPMYTELGNFYKDNYLKACADALIHELGSGHVQDQVRLL